MGNQLPKSKGHILTSIRAAKKAHRLDGLEWVGTIWQLDYPKLLFHQVSQQLG